MENDNNHKANSLFFPVRRRLPHVPPVAVSQYAAGAEYFMTVCVDRLHYGIQPFDSGRRGPLVNDAIASVILDSLEFRKIKGEWHPSFALVMPDHVHFISSFDIDTTIDKTVSNWKRFLARECGIVWQRGFFDHRLRNEVERAEKWQYIHTNPVSKGLCATPEEWPFRRTWQ